MVLYRFIQSLFVLGAFLHCQFYFDILTEVATLATSCLMVEGQFSTPVPSYAAS